jgi:hypothetical protein
MSVAIEDEECAIPGCDRSADERVTNVEDVTVRACGPHAERFAGGER